MRLEALREELVRLHAELPRQRPGRLDRRQRQRPRPGDRARGDQAVGRPLRGPDRGLDGRARPRRTDRRGRLHPSSDTASHLYIYRHRPDVNGVVHTHSRYATAFAAVGRSIPVYLTAQADEFGGEIPCAGLRAASATRRSGRSWSRASARSPGDPAQEPRRLHRSARRPTAAVKAAVMVEDVAATVWAALQIGTPEVLPDDVVERLHRPLHERLRPVTAERRGVPPCVDLGAFEVWFVTGSQHLYGPETLETVAEHAPAIAAALDAAAVDPGPRRRQAGRDRLRRHPGPVPARPTPTPPASGSSPGCTRSRRPRCGSPASTSLQRPLLHLHTQYNRRDPVGRRSTWTS